MKPPLDIFEIPLIETVSGSGAPYSNEDYILQTKAEEAVLTNRANVQSVLPTRSIMLCCLTNHS
ncbi:MAG: lysozyme inhibitor [Hyphomicrobiales bacterium]|nr:lysozyme inhibitor [Hyphomicrobiales bacterium]